MELKGDAEKSFFYCNFHTLEISENLCYGTKIFSAIAALAFRTARYLTQIAI